MCNTIKISFLGDIMCGIPELQHCQIGEDEYDFSSVFSQISEYLNQSDFVCGNLETPIAGYDLNYTSVTTLFNTPIDFAKAVYECGIDMVTTANNHCLDRGLEGLKRTMNNLETVGLEYTGTNKNPYDKRYIIKDFNGCKVAIISYTYGCDSEYRNNKLKSDDEFYANIFNKSYNFPIEYKINHTKEFLKLITPEIIKRIARDSTYLDCASLSDLNDPKSIQLLERLKLDIHNAKAEADLVIMCLHIGGQYNNELGDYTKEITSICINEGCDYVIGNHPHCVLPVKVTEKRKIIAYALGNFCFTPNWGYYVKGVYSDYSVILSLSINTETKNVENVFYRISKSVREGNHTSIKLVSDIYKNATSNSEKKTIIEDVIEINKRLFGNNNFRINKTANIEQLLYENSIFD